VPASTCVIAAPEGSFRVIVKPSPTPTSPVSTGLSVRVAPAEPARSAPAPRTAAKETPTLTTTQYAAFAESVSGA